MGNDQAFRTGRILYGIGGRIMARLPEPVTEGINATWPEGWALSEKNFNSIIGQAIRKAAMAKKKENKGGNEDKKE